jgi:hypothetical protein
MKHISIRAFLFFVVSLFAATTAMAEESKPPTEPVEREALVITWQSKSGKWYAHGPTQKTSTTSVTEKKAMSYAAPIDQKRKDVEVKATFIKEIFLAKRKCKVNLYKLNFMVKDKNKGPTWGRDIRYSYPELKDIK